MVGSILVSWKIEAISDVVVVGSHGKTTTTSLIASIFQETKIDPTIINGGVINSINNSAKLGKSDWSILEADESDGSFIYILFFMSNCNFNFLFF